MTPSAKPAAWRLLGEPSIHWAGRDLTPLLGKKALGLVAYVALAPDGTGRDEMAARLWPPADSAAELARAKHSLRQCLVSIRRAFGDGYDAAFEDADDRLTLRRDAVVVDVFQLVQSGSGGVSAPGDLADLCRGPFLRSLVTRAKPFDTWVEERRAHLTGIAGPLLEAAHAEAERSGDQALAAELGAAMDRLDIGRVNLPSPYTHPAAIALPSPRQPKWGRLAAALLAVLAICAAGAYGLSGEVRNAVGRLLDGQRQAGPPRISVLPFTSLSGTPEETSLATGITLGVNYALYAISELYPVTPAPSTRALDQTGLVDRARQLGVRYIIWGAVGTDNDDVRIDVQCFDAETRTLVWTERFRQKREHSFKLQDEITLQILKGLKIELSTAELNRIQYLQDTNSLEAWLSAARGLSHLIRVTREDVGRAEAYYREALRHDPGYVSARRGLAWISFAKVRLGWAADPATATNLIGEARNQLSVVLQARPGDGTSLSLQGAILLLDERYDEAIAAGEAALAALPRSADVNAIFAHTLTYVGQHDRALEYIGRAMELSEINPAFYRWTRGRALRLDGQFNESVRVLEQDLGKGEPVVVHLVELTASYAAAGRFDDARRLAARIRAAAPNFTATAWLSHPPIRDPAIHTKEFEYLSLAGL